MWGSDIISKEERDKTIEFSLTLPVKRSKLISGKQFGLCSELPTRQRILSIHCDQHASFLLPANDLHGTGHLPGMYRKEAQASWFHGSFDPVDQLLSLHPHRVQQGA
jgi:hypothetical protein